MFFCRNLAMTQVVWRLSVRKCCWSVLEQLMEPLRDAEFFFQMWPFWTLYKTFSLSSDWFVHVSVFVSGSVIPREDVNVPFSLCVLQVLARRVQGGGEHQRLSGHLLSLLRGSPVPRAHGALHPVHGQPRGLHFLPAQDAWLQTLGVQPSQRSWWTPALLREVPALHALLPGLRVQTWTRVLLYLWVGGGVWNPVIQHNTMPSRYFAFVLW